MMMWTKQKLIKFIHPRGEHRAEASSAFHFEIIFRSTLKHERGNFRFHKFTCACHHFSMFDEIIAENEEHLPLLSYWRRWLMLSRRGVKCKTFYHLWPKSETLTYDRSFSFSPKSVWWMGSPTGRREVEVECSKAGRRTHNMSQFHVTRELILSFIT